jgi:hypothetical protein
MDLLKMIADLRSERAAIDDALLVLEKLASSHRGQRRGRPPAWMTAQIAAASVTPVGKPVRAKRTRVLSAEVKQKMAESQRKRWEAYRKAKGQG